MGRLDPEQTTSGPVRFGAESVAPQKDWPLRMILNFTYFENRRRFSVLGHHVLVFLLN